MRAELRERVCKSEKGELIEVCELHLKAMCDDEVRQLEMFKARATRHQILSAPTDPGDAVLWMKRPL